jgi:putative PEP-CTERM system histidine kinase
MFDTVLSFTALSVLFVLSVYSIARRRTIATVAFSLSALLLACLEGVDYLLLNTLYGPVGLQRLILFLQSLLPIVLLFYALTYARQWSGRAISPVWKAVLGAAFIFPVIVLVFPTGSFLYSPDLQADKMLFLGRIGYGFHLGIMFYCILSLVNLEATFSSALDHDRWKIKFESVGMIGILAVLIFYYSQGLLYRTINMNLVPVRSGIVTIGALLVGYSKLFRGNDVRIVVSRLVLYRSLTLVATGCYLLFLGLIGEGMRYLGVNVSRDLSIFVAFTSGILLLIVVMSGQLRRKFKVLISKHFFRHKHDYRTEWLRFTERLALCKSRVETHDAILTTFRQTFGLQGASLYLFDRSSKTFSLEATQNLPGRTLDLAGTLPIISYFTEKDRVFSSFNNEYVPTREEAEFIEKSGARQIVPLMENNDIEGLIVLGAQLVKERFTYEDYNLMKTFARQAVLSLLNMRLSEELAETREIAAVAKISSFVVHDLKNLVSTLSLLLSNAEQYMGDPGFQEDMIETMRNTLGKMQGLMQRLRGMPKKLEMKREQTDIAFLVREIVEDVRRTKPRTEILHRGCSVDAAVDVEEMKKVVLNLLLNALDASGDTGTVSVTTGRNGRSLYVKVEDGGCGMTQEFMNDDLFKPFRSTKKRGLGIGLYQCKQIVEAHHGSIGVESASGKGAIFTVSLPLADRKGGRKSITVSSPGH